MGGLAVWRALVRWHAGVRCDTGPYALGPRAGGGPCRYEACAGAVASRWLLVVGGGGDWTALGALARARGTDGGVGCVCMCSAHTYAHVCIRPVPVRVQVGR